MEKVLLSEMSRTDVAGRTFEVAVLPIGACEQHAMHLPFGNDSFHAGAVARRSAELAAKRGARVLVLPTIPYGCDQNQMEFPYTTGLQPTTIIRIFDDLIGGLAKHGLRKFLLLNGHGGNTGTLDAVSRELYDTHGAFIARVDWWHVPADVVAEVQETDELEHADEIETSIALALCPELVDMDASEPAPSRRARLVELEKYGGKFSRPWHLFTRNGGVGDPTKATREKGERIVVAAVERIAGMLVELAGAKYDERFPY